MKIKITQPIINLEGKPLYQPIPKRDDNGKPIRNENGEAVIEDKIMTWREVAYNSLESRASNDERLSAEDKIKCAQIERKLYESDEPDLNEKERTFLIERIQKTILSPMICFAAEDFFGDKNVKEAKV